MGVADSASTSVSATPPRPAGTYSPSSATAPLTTARLSARERDRHRQEVLEGMLWQFHRIWSTDWFHRRSREIEKLEDALAKARDGAKLMVVPGANAEGRKPGGREPVEATEVADDRPAKIGMSAPTYRSVDTLQLRVLARPRPGSDSSESEPHLVPVSRLAEIVRKVVEAEGPVHVDLVARRVAAAFGKGRTGSRIVAATQAALRHARRQEAGELLQKGGFWLTRAQSGEIPVRDRSGVNGGVGKPSFSPADGDRGRRGLDRTRMRASRWRRPSEGAGTAVRFQADGERSYGMRSRRRWPSANCDCGLDTALALGARVRNVFAALASVLSAYLGPPGHRRSAALCRLNALP